MKVYANEYLIVVIDGKDMITYDPNDGESGISIYKNNKYIEDIPIEDMSIKSMNMQEKANDIISKDKEEDLDELPNDLVELLELC